MIEPGSKGLGLLGKSPPDFRDYLYAAPARVLTDLPLARDLRESKSEAGKLATPKVLDQGNLGSCTANCTNSTVQFIERLHGDPDQDRLSRLWTYYYTREKINTVNEDSGGMIRDAIAVTSEKGVPREIYWPYDITRFTEKPTSGERSAPHHKALEYRSVQDGNEQEMQGCLAEGYPFVFGFAVYQSFWSIGDDGRWNGERGIIDGYHAVAAWGYDFTPGAFGFELGGWIVRNSWGTEFGDGGYYYVPRRYMATEAFDCWTIRKVSR